MLDQTFTKGLCIVILFVVSALSGLVPMWLHHRGILSRTATSSPCARLTLDLLKSFAGGVFLGVCLLNLLVEGSQDFAEYKEKVGFNTDFPFYEAGAGLGLFLITLAEKLGFALISFFKEDPTSSGEAAGTSRRTREAGTRPSFPTSIATSFQEIPAYPPVTMAAATAAYGTVSTSQEAKAATQREAYGEAVSTSETAPLLSGSRKVDPPTQSQVHGEAVSTSETAPLLSASRKVDPPTQSQAFGEAAPTSETAPLLSAPRKVGSPSQSPARAEAALTSEMAPGLSTSTGRKVDPRIQSQAGAEAASTSETARLLRSPIKLPTSDGDNRPQPRTIADLFKGLHIPPAGQGRSGQGQSGQGRSGQGQLGQGRSGQGPSGQRRLGQGYWGQQRWGQGSSVDDPSRQIPDRTFFQHLTNLLERSTSPDSPVEGDEVDSEHHHHHISLATSKSCYPQDISEMSALRAVLLLVPLSLHTVFDGLAVGLQKTIAQVWGILVGIAVHKAVVSFCLGVDLATTSTSGLRRPVFFILLFALIAPLGVGVGMGVTSSHLGHDVVAQLLLSAILQALATGTFLYVTFEILGQQFAHAHAATGATFGRDMAKLFATVVGFACMAGVKVLGDSFD